MSGLTQKASWERCCRDWALEAKTYKAWQEVTECKGKLCLVAQIAK